MPSKALEANVAKTRMDITISEKYRILLEVMSKYEGIREGLNTLLTELCHPYKNWRFIVKEARGYSLKYFHLLRTHPKGREAAKLYIDIFLQSMEQSREGALKADAADNLLLFLQTVIKESGGAFQDFLPVLDYACTRIKDLEKEPFSFFVRSYYQINRLVDEIQARASSQNGYGPMNSLLRKYLEQTYSYWLGEKDPFDWFTHETRLEGGLSDEFKSIFLPISHETITTHLNEVNRAVRDYGNGSLFLMEILTRLPGYRQIVDIYREIPQEILKVAKDSSMANYLKLVFLFRIMNIEGLSSIHEEVLRDINRSLTKMIDRETPEVLSNLIQKTFDILKESVSVFPSTALHCALNVGKAVYKTDESDLVDFFIDALVDLGFQTPDLRGVSEDWQMRVNAAHIQNIRTWLELIELNPKWSKKLLSSLIIHLSLGGVFIKDTDLFSRDITGFLNADIAPVYNLAKQLTRLFPSYFNEIGAEGQLRDISTKIDEICGRKDVLVHFLRKQSHVESSNQIINLMEATIEFWLTRDKRLLKPYVPSNIYNEIETEGPYVDGVHLLMKSLFENIGMTSPCDLVKIQGEDLEEKALGVSGVSQVDQERVILAIRFYKLLYQKYSLGSLELKTYVEQFQPHAFPELNMLRSALLETDSTNKLKQLLVYLEKVKDVILSENHFEIREDIYQKRHFAVDIPSMYGSYHEMKFDALGLTFRLESFVNTLFEDLVDQFDLELITRDTFFKIYDYLSFFYQALKLDGIISAEMERQLDLLARATEVMDFSFTQFLDIFRGLSQAVKNIVTDYFNNTHEPNLIKLLEQSQVKKALLPKYMPRESGIDNVKLIHRVTEIFLRERISSALGLQQLDLFLSRIMKTLFQQADKLPPDALGQLLNYDPEKAITAIHPVKKKVSGIIYLGNKGLNLVRLNNYGFPVPPGFILTTEVFRRREVIDTYLPAVQNLKDQLANEISLLETLTGKTFGKSRNPLLLSVRSGAPISQPGMMDTFLDVGINEDIVQGIIELTGNEWFAWDCYRRFLQSYGMVFGLTRNDFDDIIARFKKELGIPFKRDFTGAQMRSVTLAYKTFIGDNGIEIEESPWDQLYVTIRKVFDSWNTHKAQTYRKIMRISDEWGTAVTVQAMVFGNFSMQSGAGVVFTHSPRWPGDMVNLWGDFTLGNQGEDVVSGLVKTLPISKIQAETENRESDIILETHFNEIYRTIRELAKDLIYQKQWGPQEMEFTFESMQKKDLYFLQTRDMAIRERKKVLSFVTTADTESRRLGHGIGVSGGAMTGRAVFNLAELQKWREREPETSLVLIRGDTVPDDIQEIDGADGILTARGGSTSHAAIVAHRLGKTCVVGCANLVCMEKESRFSLDNVSFKAGDWVSIDGREGSVYSGKIEVEEVARR